MKLYFFLVDETLQFEVNKNFDNTAEYENLLRGKKTNIISPGGAKRTDTDADQAFLHIYNNLNIFSGYREMYAGCENEEIFVVDRTQATGINDWIELLPEEEANCILLIPREFSCEMYEQLPHAIRPTEKLHAPLVEHHGTRLTLTIDPEKLAQQPHPYNFDVIAKSSVHCEIMLPNGRTLATTTYSAPGILSPGISRPYSYL